MMSMGPMDAHTVLARWWRRLRRQGVGAVAQAVPEHQSLASMPVKAILRYLAGTAAGQTELRRHLQSLRRMIAQHTKEPGGVDKEEQADVWRAAASTHRALGELAEVARCLHRAAELDPECALVQGQLEILTRMHRVVRESCAPDGLDR